MKQVVITRSNKSDKRFTAEFPNKKIHFGSKGGSTFIDHGNTQTKRAWEARHRVNEDWRDWDSAGALAKNILWNKNSLRASLTDLNSKQKQYKFSMKRMG